MTVVDPVRPRHSATDAPAPPTRLDIPRARRALADLHAALAGPPPARHEALERARPVVAACGDALARAEFTLVEARMQAPREAIGRVIADLRFAVQVFQANGRDADEAAAWCALSAWLHQSGLAAPALQCVQRALAIEQLPPDLRLAMMDAMLPTLAQTSGVDVAWQAYRALFEPYVAAAPRGLPLARARLALANLHALDAMQRAGLRGRANLWAVPARAWLDGPVPAMAPALAAARRELAAAVALGPAPVVRMAGTLEAALHALEGRVDDAVAGFGTVPLQGLADGVRLEFLGWTYRINGRWHDALACLRPALAAAQVHGADALQLAALIESAICLDQLGDAPAAARAWAESVALLARSQRLPADGLPGLPGSQALPADSPSAVRLRRAEPPCVARALRHMREHLSQRLSLADLAREAEVSPRTLQAAFRDYRGATVVASYRQLALQQGRDLLMLTARPIKEIAADCGYRSTATFTRDFSATYGLPPAAFRRHAAGRAGEATG